MTPSLVPPVRDQWQMCSTAQKGLTKDFRYLIIYTKAHLWQKTAASETLVAFLFCMITALLIERER